MGSDQVFHQPTKLERRRGEVFPPWRCVQDSRQSFGTRGRRACVDTKYHLIANIPQSLLDTIAKSEYSTHFSKEISYWKKTLSKIGDVTREWIAVQEMWTDLSKAFAIKGFKDSIENGAGFEDLNKRYVSLWHLVMWTKSKRTATFFREAFPKKRPFFWFQGFE